MELNYPIQYICEEAHSNLPAKINKFPEITKPKTPETKDFVIFGTDFVKFGSPPYLDPVFLTCID